MGKWDFVDAGIPPLHQFAETSLHFELSQILRQPHDYPIPPAMHC